MVSYSTWADCIAHRQETVCKKFLIRHVTIAYNRGRKLFANGFLFGMGRLCKHSGRKLFAKSFLFVM